MSSPKAAILHTAVELTGIRSKSVQIPLNLVSLNLLHFVLICFWCNETGQLSLIDMCNIGIIPDDALGS